VLKYVCPWCGGRANADDLQRAPIEAGDVLRCDICTQPCVVDLFRPDERAALYGQQGESARAAELDAQVKKFKATLEAGRHKDEERNG
jgi:hypothetical protein